MSEKAENSKNIGESVTKMRDEYNQILKSVFYENLISVRNENNYTQAYMADLLMMDLRSYVELDHGNNSCSALTFALFLIYCCAEPVTFLNILKIEFETYAKRGA